MIVTASFLGGGVRRLGGFGGALIMSPVFMWIFPVTELVVLVLLAEVLGGLLLAHQCRVATEDKPRRNRLLLFAALAFPVGIALGIWAQMETLRLMTNFLIALFAAYLITNNRRHSQLTARRDCWVGLLCGGLLGSCGIGGPPAVLYLNSSPMEFERVRSLLSSFISGICIIGLSIALFLVSQWFFLAWLPIVLISYLAGVYIARTLTTGLLDNANIVRKTCLLIMFGNALINLAIAGQHLLSRPELLVSVAFEFS